jgi:ATP-dependent DNA ligase
VERAVIDGELYSGDGAEGIDAILAARQQVRGDVAFAAFDLLEVGDHEVMAEPWTDRRKRLENLFPEA